jgi:hypothetical protein
MFTSKHISAVYGACCAFITPIRVLLEALQAETMSINKQLAGIIAHLK